MAEPAPIKSGFGSNWLALLLSGILVPLMLYASVYLCLARVSYFGVAGKWFAVPVYQWGGANLRNQQLARKLFRPANWLDQRVRSEKWNPTRTPTGGVGWLIMD